MPSTRSARSSWLCGEQQQALAAPRPAAHPALPRLGVAPAGRRAVGDALEHEQLGAVQVADDRDVGRHARGRLVDRGQVVQVQDVGVGGARLLQRARPGGDVGLVGVVVEGGEDAVGGVRRGPRRTGASARRRGRSAPRGRRSPRRSARRRRDRASEPETTVTSQPCAGSSRASARATCAEPPRGKNMRAESTRTLLLYPKWLSRRERDHGRDRPPAGQHDAVILARDVAQPPGADQRGRAAAVEVERRAGAERDERLGELGQRETGLVVGAPVAGDGQQPPVGA